MRENKFRAWDETNRTWIIVILEHGANFFPKFHKQHEPRNLTEWQQFSGCKDKNGKEVYEGDILNVPIKSLEHPKGKSAIVKCDDFNNWTADFGEYPDWDWSEICYDHQDRIEVIGNIHENPEVVLEHEL